MAKDYAKYAATKSRQGKKTWRMEWLIVGILGAIVFGSIVFGSIVFALLFKYAHSASVSTLIANTQSFFHRTPTVPSEKQKIKTSGQPLQEVRFDFYDELPKMQVVATETPSTPVTPEPNKNVNAIATTTLPEKNSSLYYILELGVFKDLPSASQLRVSLLLSGLDTEIVKVKNEKEELFRVQRGPYTNLPQAKNMQQRLQKKGVISEIRKTSVSSTSQT